MVLYLKGIVYTYIHGADAMCQMPWGRWQAIQSNSTCPLLDLGDSGGDCRIKVYRITHGLLHRFTKPQLSVLVAKHVITS